MPVRRPHKQPSPDRLGASQGPPGTWALPVLQVWAPGSRWGLSPVEDRQALSGPSSRVPSGRVSRPPGGTTGPHSLVKQPGWLTTRQLGPRVTPTATHWARKLPEGQIQGGEETPAGRGVQSTQGGGLLGQHGAPPPPRQALGHFTSELFLAAGWSKSGCWDSGQGGCRGG